jgi:hypothetical protein
MAVKGGAAIPISEQTTGAVKAGPAIPVYGYTGTPSDRPAGAGPARPIKLLTDADLRQNGGAFVVAGTPAEPMYDAPAGMAVASGPAQPIYLVGGALAGGGQAQTKWYVDATLGLDTNPGTQAAPWQTLAKVNGYTFPANAQIFLKCGERWVNQSLIVHADNLSFGAYGSGANPIIDGSLTMTGWALDSGAIYKTACTLADSATRATFENGVRLIRKTTKVSLAVGSYFLDDAGDMLYVWTTDGTDPTGKTIKFTSQQQCIDSNYHSNLVFDSIDTTMAYYSGYDVRRNGGHDILVKNATSTWNGQRGFNAGAWALAINHDRVTFQSCVTHDNIGEGFWIGYGTGCGATSCISYNNGLDCTAAKGYTIANAGVAFTIGSSAVDCFLKQCTGYNGANAASIVSIEWVLAEGNQPLRTIIDRNQFYRTSGVLAHLYDMGLNSVITNNMLWATTATVYLVRIGYSATQVSTNCLFVGNTLATNQASTQELLYGYYGTGLVCKDNIYYGAGTASTGAYYIATTCATGFVSDYNEWSVVGQSYWGPTSQFRTFALWKTASSQDANSRNDADPVFVNAAIQNFHLQVTSPCKDVGIAVAALVTDYDGVARADPPDIGAFEYV